MLRHADPGGFRISLLALPEATPFALYGLFEVFSSIGRTWSELTGEPAATEPPQVAIVGESREPFTCAAGAPIAPHRAMADVNATDLVLTPDIAFPPDGDPGGRWPAAVEWLRRQHAGGATICSVCSGSILLAEAGLLHGREATTHWAYRDLFARRYPEVRLRMDSVLLGADGDSRVITAGGASSWEDLALYLIARFFGPAEAVRTAKLFLFGDRSEGQLPYAAPARPRDHGDGAVHAAQLWIADNYALPRPVERMAGHAGLSLRTFKRRFAAATGMAPLAYVQALRIEEAKQLLERTDDGPEEIAAAVGYADPTFFRRLFKRIAGVTPARYRRRYQPVTR